VTLSKGKNFYFAGPLRGSSKSFDGFSTFDQGEGEVAIPPSFGGRTWPGDSVTRCARSETADLRARVWPEMSSGREDSCTSGARDMRGGGREGVGEKRKGKTKDVRGGGTIRGTPFGEEIQKPVLSRFAAGGGSGRSTPALAQAGLGARTVQCP